MTPRFEIKAIRSWSRGRDDAKRPRRASGSGSASTAEADLSAVLEAYDRRFESAVAEQRTEQERRAEFRNEASGLLETLIVPTLRDVGSRVSDHGHDWKVESRIDILAQPAVACTFSPREKRGNSRHENELSFRFVFPDRMMVAAAGHDGSEIAGLPPRSYSVDQITAELVTAEATRFVRRVLE